MREREGARARRTAKVRERERMWILQNIKNLHNKKKQNKKQKRTQQGCGLANRAGDRVDLRHPEVQVSDCK